jgi:hypothetical protein
MTELVAWAVFPLVALAIFLGAGLAAERAAGLRLPAPLVPALGFCVALVVAGLPAAAGLGAAPIAAAVLAAGTAGLWLARRELRERFRPGAGASAGAAVYALHMAPVLLSGEATFLGYNLLNDTAIHFALVDYVSEHGRHEVELAPSSYAAAMGTYVGASYPLGSHELLAALRALVDADVARVYQPYIALSAALAAAAIVALLGDRLPGARRGAALAATAALSGQLVFSFTLQGGIKELTFVAALATAAALSAELLRAERPVRGAPLLAVAVLAGYAIYGVAALAWIGPLVVALVAIALASRESPLRRRLVPAALAGVAAFALLGWPTVAESVEFYRHGEQVLTSEAELGPLAGPLQAEQALGIWLNGDYRVQPRDRTATNALLLVAGALVLLGALLVARRRLAGAALLVVPSVVAWAVVSRTGSPYVDAKLLAVMSPAVVLLAALGVALLWRGRLRLIGALAALVLTGGLLVSDAYAYRLALPAPIDRLSELRTLAERFDGEREPMLVNEFEEHVKHFGRAARAFNPYEPWTVEPARLLGEPRPLFGHAYTLDEIGFDFYARYPTIVLRRSPVESRPPAGYRRAWRGRWYEVWRRTEPVEAAVRVPFGRPAQTPVTPAVVPPCRELRELSESAEAVAAVRPPTVVVDLAAPGPLPAGWERYPVPGTLVARGGGTVSATARTAAGRFRAWVKGSLHRRFELRVDGRRVGDAKHLNTANQWLRLGELTLRAGPHRVELERPTGSLAPGDAQGDVVGPVVLEPLAEARLVRVPRGEGDRLCGLSLDWVERLPSG